MNSTMNAATLSINPSSNSDSNLKHRSQNVDLNLLHRHDTKSPMLRSRKRTSAIESPSDLLVDHKKDDLLSTSCEDKRNPALSVMYDDALVTRFQKTNNALRFLYDRNETFKHALELFNRSHCVLENGCWQSNGNFFECKGAIRVVQRMCTRCRDIDKPRTKTDLYYVDLAERHRERTVFCHGCMGKIVCTLVGTNLNIIKKQLKKLRKRQQSGIYIMSRGNQ